MKKIADSKWLENIVMLGILISSICLALETPLNDQDGTKAKVLKYVDLVTTIFFSIEIVIKVIAYGLYFNGKNSYLRNYWQILDFLFVIFSILALLPLDLNGRMIKSVRMIRLLRPLRIIAKN